MSSSTNPREAHTRSQIHTRLANLGWVIDELDPDCNVFQERAKTNFQNQLFEGKRPDYVLYESGTDIPLAVIEAKKPGGDLDRAMEQAIERYAKPLQAPLAFAFNDTFVISKHVLQNRPLKINGEELQDFIDQLTAIRFMNEGSEILSSPRGLTVSRSELIDIFKDINKRLRKDGLREGYERFSAVAEVLFLKLVDESELLREHKGDQRQFDESFLWSNFTQKFHNDDAALYRFVADSVWRNLQNRFGDIFNAPFSIKKGTTLRALIDLVDPINLTAMDSDVKGDAFEFFLKTVTNGNKDLGEYFTPRHVVRTVVNIVKPKHGDVLYDPFCGTGGFLLEAFKYLSLRSNAKNAETMNWIRTKALHGREITSTARITRMNMILFGDGHTNITQMDSLENPIRDKYDIVVSNIPYSQKTDSGSLYPIPTDNGDAICMQHIWLSLKDGGRAAVIVPETFLYSGGVIGKTRELIVKSASKLSVFSLPRGVFMPYTPTKTNILYFEKGDKQFSNSFFFVIHNDGFELNTKRKPIDGESDIKRLLSELDAPTAIDGQAIIVDRDTIKSAKAWNLRPFLYMEDVPRISGCSLTLDDTILDEITLKIDPGDCPDKDWDLITVSQNGIFLGDRFKGSEATQKYKQVKAGDIVYNPYRVNIGSIGVVPNCFDGALTSPAYVVARVKNPAFSPEYIVSVLKHPRYLRVIMNYSLSSARASLPFDELTRIVIPAPTQDDVPRLQELQREIRAYADKVNELSGKIYSLAESKLEH